jgi:hypothetical protein
LAGSAERTHPVAVASVAQSESVRLVEHRPVEPYSVGALACFLEFITADFGYAYSDRGGDVAVERYLVFAVVIAGILFQFAAV